MTNEEMLNILSDTLKGLFDMGCDKTQAKLLLGVICYEQLESMKYMKAERNSLITKAFLAQKPGSGETPYIEVEKGMKIAKYVDIKPEYRRNT